MFPMAAASQASRSCFFLLDAEMFHLRLRLPLYQIRYLSHMDVHAAHPGTEGTWSLKTSHPKKRQDWLII